jgi:hypothetical protein
MKTSTRTLLACALNVLVMASLACTFSLFELPTLPTGPTLPPFPVVPSPTPQPRAQTTFVVALPEPLAPGEALALAILDEVTGLALNATLYPMTARDSLTYTAVLPLPVQSIVKYRYVRRSNVQVMEDSAAETTIRYRMLYVAGPGEVQDILASWADRAYARPIGSIQGRVLNADTGAAVPNILVSAGGLQSITDSAGRFDLQALPAGTHNLVAYALDGIYLPFQQGAAVAGGLNTAVEVRVRPSPLVKVTFTLTPPGDSVQGAPIRIAGNLLQLGNTFADLKGGLSTVADRMPVMALQPDGRYMASVNLPVGAYVQYKYTLGDGFWNAEHNATGEFRLREFSVPAQDIVLQDTVQTWQAGASAPILFEVSVPSNTPVGDIIYIQFNPFDWTESIPMWPEGNNQWAYKLYSPLNMLGTFHYRYCRDGQCGSADDLGTVGDTTRGREVATSLTAQDILDSVNTWAWLEHTEPTTLVGTSITPRQPGFMSGVEFQSAYLPNWSYYMPQALANVQALGATWSILSPTWTYTGAAPVEFAPVPGRDPLWVDTAVMVSQARALNLNVAVFPTARFPADPATFWRTGVRDAGWWQVWFDHYRAFAVNYADLATQTGAQALILGGDWLGPAMPGGTLADGAASGVPADAEARWKAVIAEARQHFSGRILWALPYTPGAVQTPLSFLQDTDGIYLLWNAALASQAGTTKDALVTRAGSLLDNEVSPLAAVTNKPLIIAIAYPSAAGASTGCFIDGKGGCLDWSALSRPNADVTSVGLDLQGQLDLYDAMLTAINTRPWVGGVVSRGYYPPAALQDKSASVHGKPAADLLWYWLPRLTGVVK